MKSLIVALLLLPGSLRALEVKYVGLDSYERDGKVWMVEARYTLSHAGQSRGFGVEFIGDKVLMSEAEILALADAKAKEFAARWQANIDNPPAGPVKTIKAADRAVSL